MRFLAMELGGYFGLMLMIVAILYSFNVIFLKFELSDLVFRKLRTAKYRMEEVLSFEEIVRMKVFIQKLKKNKDISALLRADPETADFMDSGDEFIHHTNPFKNQYSHQMTINHDDFGDLESHHHEINEHGDNS